MRRRGGGGGRRGRAGRSRPSLPAAQSPGPAQASDDDASDSDLVSLDASDQDEDSVTDDDEEAEAEEEEPQRRSRRGQPSEGLPERRSGGASPKRTRRDSARRGSSQEPSTSQATPSATGSRVALAKTPSSRAAKTHSKTPSSSKPRKKEKKDGKGKPLELFRTDFISAMKIPDQELVDSHRVIRVTDAWRHEWNNGVQIPAGHDEAQHSRVEPVPPAPSSSQAPAFKAPKKLIRLSKDADFDPEVHVFSDALSRAEAVCRYDLDEVDAEWLELVNEGRRRRGEAEVSPADVEAVMEAAEGLVYEGVQKDLLQRQSWGRGREFEEDSVCDVCWMPDSAPGNEMVFCDRCDLAVHQVCYGTGPLPKGAWLCRACSICPSATCCLCPNKGGALKPTKSSARWAHVSCVWWIPEVKFEDPDRMEPVVSLRSIPADRWNLKCAMCGKREGACIQCSAHKCPVAYHVTCAQMAQPGVHMKWETKGDNVNLVSFCRKHTELYNDRRAGGDASPDGAPSSSQAPIHSINSYHRPSVSGRPHDSPLKRKLKRQALLESRFWTYVSPTALATSLKLDGHLVDAVYEFWKLKRCSRRNESLMTPKVEEELILEKHDREVLMRKVRIFVGLRQNLEKARNLTYMVQKRERLKAAYVRLREENFEALERLLSSQVAVSGRELERLSAHLAPTNEYEAEGSMASDAQLSDLLQDLATDSQSPPRSPARHQPRSRPQSPPKTSAKRPSPPSSPPKAVVHLRRIPSSGQVGAQAQLPKRASLPAGMPKLVPVVDLRDPPPRDLRDPPHPALHLRSPAHPDHPEHKKPLVVLKYLGEGEEKKSGRSGRRSESEAEREALSSAAAANGPPPKRSRLISALDQSHILATGPLRRSLPTHHSLHSASPRR